MKIVFGLSPRLSSICEYLIAGEDVWDFCCDHGLVGFHAYQSQNFPKVFLVDKVPNIISKLEQQFKKYFAQTNSNIQIQFLNQLGQDLNQNVLGNLVIAGVGTATIIQILDGLKARSLLRAGRLILAPQKNPELLTKYFETNYSKDYLLTTKKTILEKGRERHIFIYDQLLSIPTLY